MALKKYTSPNITGKFIQFVGGLNSTGGPLSLTEQESSKLQNIDFDKFGSVVKRAGSVNVNSVPLNQYVFTDEFEDWSSGSGGPPDDWSVVKVTATRESTIVHGGTYSSKVLMGDEGGYGWQARDISTLNGHTLDYWKGRTLTFTCSVYCERADEAFIAIGAKDPEALNWEASGYHPGDSAWHELSVTYTIPSNATHLNLICGVLDGPSVHMPQTPAYFDDAFVTDVTTAIDHRITCLQDYQLSSGEKHLVVIAGESVGQWDSSSISGDPTVITGDISITPGHLFSSAVFRDTALFTDGVDAPFQWDGTGNCSLMTVPTDLTAAKFVAVFQNYTFLANVTVDGINYRSRVHYSNINSISAWTAFDFVDVSRDDGQMITGIKVLGDKLVVFKDRTIWVAQFTGDADIPFQFSQTNASVGCVSHFSIQEVDNGLVFLSWDGLYFFDGFNAYKISDRLNFTFHDDLATLQFPNAVSMYQHTKNRYWLGIASNGNSTNDTVITWTKANTTTQTDAFSVYKGLSPSAMQIVYLDGITEVPYFGDYSGFVYKADTGVDDYPIGVQTAIDAYYYTNWISFDDICDQKGTLSTYIYYQNNTATLTFVYAYDLNDQDQNIQTFSMSTGGALWDTATWDSDVWAGGSASLMRRDIDGRGRLIRFAFKNNNLSETFRIDGIGTLTYLETNV